MRYRPFFLVAAVLFLFFCPVAGAQPAWLVNVGFINLQNEYGAANLATGSNVPVTIVETYSSRTVADDPTTPPVLPPPNDKDPISYSFYNLDLSQGFFAGKTIVHKGPTPPTSLFFRDGVTVFQVPGLSVQTSHSSPHGNNVGAYFFGTPPGGFTQRSVAPGINNIEVFDPGWNNSYFLNPGTIGPHVSANLSRVATHAYQQGDSLSNVQRMDWLVATDDYVQIVGTPFVSGHGNAFNTLAVAHATTAQPTATDPLSGSAGTPYIAGRSKPEITGPIGTVSDNTGAVGGLAALLISRSRNNAALSNHSYTARPGYIVRSADTSEVVKAAIMAGGNRAGVSSWRVNVANQTVNGLDNRWGTGLMNAYNSYKIIDAGETNSKQDSISAAGGAIGQYGFDYDPSFGGGAGSNATATYTFQASADSQFAATLAWNVNVTGPTGQFNNFDGSATLYNLDLTLTDLTTGLLVASSLSAIDSTENIWTNLVANHQYAMTVTAVGVPFNWDYGLGWRATAPLPEPATASLLLGGAALLLTRRRRS